MDIKIVTVEELDSVMKIINQAKVLLGKNSLQWQQGYPNELTMKNDINSHNLVGIYDNNELIGFESLIKGIDLNYISIDGKWSSKLSVNDLQIHRIAVREDYHGKKIGDYMIKIAIGYAKKNRLPSIKVDTHKANIPMQTVLTNNGFKYRGIITLKRNEIDNQRQAYELVLKKSKIF